MAKRKTFIRIDTNVSKIEYSRDACGRVAIPLELVPPPVTEVIFPKRSNARSRERFDFKCWYGVGIDTITYACQKQIERFLSTHDGDRSPASIAAYCENGMRHFLSYCAFLSKSISRPLELDDVNRELIDGFIHHLSGPDTRPETKRCRYKNTKSVLVALGKRNLLNIIEVGDNATFPRNPYPNSNRLTKGEKPLLKAQRKAFAQAVKTALMPLLHDVKEPTGELLSYALLVIALRTGRNTTPLLEMSTHCLRPHPKENIQLLVLHKRRGSNMQRVPVRSEKSIENTAAVWTGIVRIIERVKELTLPLRPEAPDHLQDRLWVYRAQRGSKSTTKGSVVALSDGAVAIAISKLVSAYDLQDSNGRPLRINISILRQTFANRMYELLDGDLATTAIAMGNTPRVAGRHYMKPSESSERQWKFMGQAMHEELLAGNLRATEKTPTGRCSNNKEGQFAPKNGATCMNFLDCLRCRNYVVTGDDLHRLFSFYWLIVKERKRVEKSKWQRKYAHIIRLIDRDVIAKGLHGNIFQKANVDSARERARVDPHPFWTNADTLEAML